MKIDHLVVDIETVPNPDVEFNKELKFTPAPANCIVAISLMGLKNTGCFVLKSVGEESDEEEVLLRNFIKAVHHKNFSSVFITWGGRFFDFPVMLFRAMHYGIPAPKLHKALGYRYNSDVHVDLVDQMSYFGATTKFGMAVAAQSIGLPGKVGMDGGKVEAAYDEGKIIEIRKYCCLDVVQTGLIFLKWILARGEISIPEYNSIVKSVLASAQKLELDVKTWDQRLLVGKR